MANFKISTEIIQTGNPAIVKATLINEDAEYQAHGAAGGVMDAEVAAINRVYKLSKGNLK